MKIQLPPRINPPNKRKQQPQALLSLAAYALAGLALGLAALILEYAASL